MEINFIVLSALTVGIVQLIKGFKLPSNLVPAIALGVGIVLSLLARPINGMAWFLCIFQGLVLGLTSVGLYSGVKNTLQQ